MISGADSYGDMHTSAIKHELQKNKIEIKYKINMISGADSYGDIHKPAKSRSHR